jgi:anti-sigma factor RsiW
MSDFDCGTIRELIPDFVGSRLPADDLEIVEAHVLTCADCRAELELAQMILAGRPAAPSGLLDRITRAVELDRVDRRAPTRTWWGISAAAVAALALGIGITSKPASQGSEVPGYAYEVDEGEIWVSGDGLLAGAPLFDGLSDDALAQLLDELSTGQTGGSA